MATKVSKEETPIRIGSKLGEAFDKLQEKIRERAYHRFLQRGQEAGDSVADWLDAQLEILKPVELEVKEQKKNIIVESNLKGLTAKEIEVEVEGDRLKVFGTHTESGKKNKGDVTESTAESFYFYQSVILPDAVDLDHSHAKLFKNGKLKVTLPRASAS